MHLRGSYSRLAPLVVILGLAGLSHAQEAFGTADPMPARPAKPSFVPWSLQFGFDFDHNPLPAFTLPPINEAALFHEDAVAAQSGDKVVRYGLGRDLLYSVQDGVWHDLGQGRWLWTGEIASSGAVGLRLHVVEMNLPERATMIVWAPSDREHIAGPYTGRGPNENGEVWTPTRAGERVRVEYFLDGVAPGTDLSQPPFAIDRLQHIYRDPVKIAQYVGAGPCHNDVTCYPAYSNLKYASAGIGTIGSNALYCSGTQLNTLAGDLTPYFLTANHCLSTAGEASNAEIYWNYHTSSCNGVPPALSSVPTSPGCTLLSTGSTSDYTLLLVNGALPSGLYWAGWTPSIPANGSPGFCIHHPAGDFKRISFGNYSSTTECGGGSHFRVNWTNAPTEPGSSGSGYFRGDTQQLVGQLHCGPSACGNETYDQYGRFADTYGSISAFLAGGSDDSLEENDTCGGNPDIAVGTYNGLVVKSTDEDWYEISVPNGAMLTVNLSFTHANGDIDTQLWVNCADASYADISQSVGNSEHLEWVNDTGSANTVAWGVYLYSDTRNNYNMTVSLTPPNNTCANAVTLFDNSSVEGSNFNASNSIAGTCGLSSTSSDVWYTYTANATGLLAIWTCGSALDTVISVYTDCTGSTLLACLDDAQPGAPCGYGTYQTYLTVPVVSGNDYKIRVAGYNGAEGSFIIRADVDTGAPFCIGDGISGNACPCSNNSTTSLEAGCLNSTGTAGRLTASGTADVSSDNVTLNGSAMPANSTCLFFQGTAKQNSGAGALFGDGLRCAAGTVIRLASKTNSATGASSFPTGLDPDLHVKGLIPVGGGVRYYQIWYRNAALFCTASTFNLTNGYELNWVP